MLILDGLRARFVYKRVNSPEVLHLKNLEGPRGGRTWFRAASSFDGQACLRQASGRNSANRTTQLYHFGTLCQVVTLSDSSARG